MTKPLVTIDEALAELLLDRPVDRAAITRAYRRMAKRFHPDSMTDPEEQAWARAKFLDVQQAYELLTGIPLDQVNSRKPQAHEPNRGTRTDTSAERIIFSELVKWERHRVGHSPGYLNLTQLSLSFDPHHNSILDKGFSIPVSMISRVARSDNFLWRGAVNIMLNDELRVSFSFRVNTQQAGKAMIKERPEFASRTLRMFLGFGRDKFMNACRNMQLAVHGA